MIIAEAIVLNIGIQITAMHSSEYGCFSQYFSLIVGNKSDMPTKILRRLFSYFHFHLILHKGHYAINDNPRKPLILSLRMFNNWYKDFILRSGK